MTYQILYFSPGGHACRLAQALAQILPEGTPCEPLADQTPQAEVQLVGFEYRLTDGNRLPEPVETYLRSLTGKTVFLFAAAPLRLSSSQSTMLHRLAERYLPRECNYVGIHLCAMEPCGDTLTAFRDHAQQNPDNRRLQHWLDRSEQAQGHPDEQDLEEAKTFARHVLGLNR